MLKRTSKATFLLVGLLALPGATARPADSPPSGPVSQAQLDQALARKAGDEDAARDSIRRLLQREDVRRLARGYGLDARRAEAAVGTLHGEELRRLASQATAVNSQLAGGDELVIRMSLVALLLVIIIVILLSQR
ncbi:MAG TPA: PA2779 family protein [Vicinamibacteria bacterium]|nr:PA2779 family protein [Vicinamibacteria bacterium]